MPTPTLLPIETHLRRLETLCAHAGATKDDTYGALVQPIYTTSTFHHPADGSEHQAYFYSRADNPNRRELERVITEMEMGHQTWAFGTGAAAMQAVFFALRPGDHVVVHHNLYMGTRRLLDLLFGPWGLKITYADLRNPNHLREYLTADTKLVWAESPTNPQMEGIDIAALADISHQHGAQLLIDSTFPTPVGQQTLALGADLVMHATTKYLAGHSDLTGGTITAVEETELGQRIQQVQRFGGAVPSPFDCYQTLRGIRSVVPRYRQQCASAMVVAQALAEHPQIDQVFYPGLKTHPEYTLLQRQQYLPGAMLSFLVKGGRAEAMKLLEGLSLWSIATSLGGTESLAEHRASTEGEGTPTPQNLLRLSVGMENAQDLVDDLHAALRRLG